MGENEKFCLRWNDFESNISVAFREIREEKDLLDCTLSCGSRQIQAHKLILSACSPFFRSILRQNPHQHPLLYLKGVGFSELQSVLNFMYHGEVNIAQEELNSFLSVAEELQVKGLTQNTAPTHPKPELDQAHVSRPLPKPEAVPIPKRVRPRPLPTAPPPSQPAYHPPQQEEIQEIHAPIKIEPQPVLYPSTSVAITSAEYEDGVGNTMDTLSTEVASMEESYSEEAYEDYGGYDGQEYEGQGYGGNVAGGQKELDGDIDSQIDKYILNTGNEWTCLECGKSVKNRVHLRNHIEAQHIVTPGYPCDICGFVSKTRPALRGHKDYNHKVKK